MAHSTPICLKYDFPFRSYRLEFEPLLVRQWTQGRAHLLEHVLEHDRFDGEDHFAGFDSRQVQQIADEREQVFGA